MENQGEGPMPTEHETRWVRSPELPADLGAMRTVMAADRTLMAWVRTSLAMLSFSFTIYRFLEGFKAENELVGRNIPQHVGLFLAGMGTVAIVLGTLEYRATLRDINRLGRFRLGRPVLFVAAVLSVAGATLFVSIAFRLF
jgi:putative membrane protein